jgi:uncharacterized membrane protein YdjX (TVP38/TMEM64 family)
MNKAWLRAFAALAVVGGIAWAASHRTVFDIAAVQARVDAMGVMAPLAFISIYAIAAVLLVPGAALTLAAGALFGPFAGAFYSLIGATAGATLSFLLSRFLVGDWARRKVGRRLGELVTGIEREGWRFVAFVRLVPLFPYNILNYALGLTRIPLVSYVTATFVCMAPAAAAYSYLGYAGGAVLTGGAGAVKAALWAVALLGLVALLPGFVRRRRGRETIDTRELERELAMGGEVLVLDVRSAEEFHGAGGHVPGSVPIPVDELQSRLAELDSYRSSSLVPV